MHPQQLDGLALLQHPLAHLLPIVQKAKSDLTAPAPKISSPTAGCPSAEFDTASTPTTLTLAPAAWVETKPATTWHAMLRAPSRRPLFVSDRRPKGQSNSQHQNSATSDHSNCTGPHRLVPKPQIRNTYTMAQSYPSKYSPWKGAHRPKRCRLGSHVLRPNCG
jgi:hypothetical protein